MALPPTIPTSFIPHAAGAPVQRYKGDFIGALGLLAYLMLVLTVIAAIGVFFYGRILAAELSAKETTLAKAETGIDPAAVENFIRLRDRLVSGQQLLNNHVALSSFFAVLEKILPSSVRFTSVHITLDQKGTTLLQGSGTAKSFNALAAASAAFSADGRIKDAIFSSIQVAKDNSVSFSLSATLDPKLIAYTPPVAGATSAIPATSVVATTTKP